MEKLKRILTIYQWTNHVKVKDYKKEVKILTVEELVGQQGRGPFHPICANAITHKIFYNQSALPFCNDNNLLAG